MGHWEQKLATYMCNHCNIYNILIYFCNIHMKHSQQTSKTFDTLKTYACNMHFQHNVTLLLGRMDARCCGARR
jgi:hypothetical protein